MGARQTNGCCGARDDEFSVATAITPRPAGARVRSCSPCCGPRGEAMVQDTREDRRKSGRGSSLGRTNLQDMTPRSLASRMCHIDSENAEMRTQMGQLTVSISQLTRLVVSLHDRIEEDTTDRALFPPPCVRGEDISDVVSLRDSALLIEPFCDDTPSQKEDLPSPEDSAASVGCGQLDVVSTCGQASRDMNSPGDGESAELVSDVKQLEDDRVHIARPVAPPLLDLFDKLSESGKRSQPTTVSPVQDACEFSPQAAVFSPMQENREVDSNMFAFAVPRLSDDSSRLEDLYAHIGEVADSPTVISIENAPRAVLRRSVDELTTASTADESCSFEDAAEVGEKAIHWQCEDEVRPGTSAEVLPAFGSSQKASIRATAVFGR